METLPDQPSWNMGLLNSLGGTSSNSSAALLGYTHHSGHFPSTSCHLFPQGLSHFTRSTPATLDLVSHSSTLPHTQLSPSSYLLSFKITTRLWVHCLLSDLTSHISSLQELDSLKSRCLPMATVMNTILSQYLPA